MIAYGKVPLFLVQGAVQIEDVMSDHLVPFSGKDSGASDERRTFIRCCCGILASCKSLASGQREVYPGRIENISEKGVALRLRQRFEPGTALRLVLRRSDDGILGLLSVNVVRVLQRSNDEWVHGCVLADMARSGERKAG